MKYQRKSIPVEVHRWLDTGEDDEFPEWLTKNSRIDLVRHTGPRGPHLVVRYKGEPSIVLALGDYLVENPYRPPIGVTALVFNERYEPAGEKTE